MNNISTLCHARYGTITLSVFLGAFLALGLASCSDSTTEPTEDGQDYSSVLHDISYNVILATYVDLDTRAADLVTAVDGLKAVPGDAALESARSAWRAARRPWEQSEAFLFGPVDTKGIDPGIDSWPVNRVDLDAVLTSDAVLTKDYVDGLEGTLKGFHTIEYLLFGTDKNMSAADLTPRSLEYLTAVVRSFKGSTAQLRTSWEAEGENFVSQLAGAGSGGSVYVSQKDALQEVVDGMIAIADEVANGKINDPYSQKDRTLEESQFSDNSIADFQDNIRSIENIYRGAYSLGVNGKGIGSIVAEQQPDLDSRVTAQITGAIDAIGAMQPSFGEAIFSNTQKVEAAQAAVRELQHTLESEVLPLVTK